MDTNQKLIALISGNISRTDKKEILEKLKTDSELQGEYERLKNAMALSSHNQQLESVQIEKSYLKFRDRIKKPIKLRVLNALKYAAIIILIFTIGAVSSQLFLSIDKFSSKNKLTEIRIPKGEKAELVLADGSKVWLNSETTFKFPKDFNDDNREVQLDGEAYFEVEKDKMPFIVSSVYGKIKVLGTSFDVRAYRNQHFQTTLTEGKILFYTDKQKTYLKPGQQINLINGNTNIKEINAERFALWKNGIISFKEEELTDVFKKLERHFNITIEATQSISSIRFTGEFEHETIEEIMYLINKTKAIKYQYDKKNRILKIQDNS